jgi:hypothetical protein
LYSTTDTIILWSENKELVKYVHDVAKQLNVQIFVPDVIGDFVAIPCFIRIIDSERINEIVSYSGEGTFMNEYFNYDDCIILVSGEIRTKVPWPLSKNIEKLPVILSKKLLLPIIKSNLEMAVREAAFRKKQFKQRVFRILTLYDLIEWGSYIDKERLAFRYDTSVRTIGRDLNFLKIINPNISFEIALYNLNVKKKKIAISERQIVLQNQVKRLIDLYQLLKNGLFINVEETCTKYEISRRTIRRDIKLLEDVNPDRKILYHKVNGYY